ncbi:MAG: hypothetical protein H5U32_02535 [Pseudomonas balearica]|uniref:hypothetical protein n=1 Tax=Stutzerimonas balearica TaxID=74829 RepID=UPI0019A062FE|nr:hypothetical protein [Stutzerimonas balearica]MBC7198105.1 hypothetical protein [Stutzerimonas balearica]
MQISEYEMSLALFGQPPAKQLSARQLVDLQERPAITVALAVRRDGGTVKRFEKKVQTLSRLEAKKAARAEGWTVWCVLEVGCDEVVDHPRTRQ